MKKRFIVFTGGGTAGHVFPAFPLIDRLGTMDCMVTWVGSIGGMERQLVEQAGIPYRGVQSGKFRRYWAWRNFTDLFRIFFGFIQALILFRKNPPNLLFSKGGFVSVPPVAAARLLKIPVLSHESDVSPGLATTLNLKLGAIPLLSWEKTLRYLSPTQRKRAVVVGNPVRDVIFQGNPAKGREIAGLSQDDDRPLLLVLGGSQGAREINNLISQSLDSLLPIMAVVHQRGSGHPHIPERPGYVNRAFFNEEMPHLLAAASLAIARSGASTLWELAATATPALFIPLRVATRGDQILNAQMAKELGFSLTLEQGIDAENLVAIIQNLLSNQEKLENMKNAGKKIPAPEATDKIIKQIMQRMI